jgi:Mn-dependent DtxR family transcriptional regulator
MTKKVVVSELIKQELIKAENWTPKYSVIARKLNSTPSWVFATHKRLVKNKKISLDVKLKT